MNENRETQNQELEENKSVGQMIAEAKSFEDLYAVLDHMEVEHISLIGTQDQLYSSTRLREQIKQVEAGSILPASITRAEGLRDKVVEILTSQH